METKLPDEFSREFYSVTTPSDLALYLVLSALKSCGRTELRAILESSESNFATLTEFNSDAS